MVIESLSSVSCSQEDRRSLDKHLEDVIALLDACNSVQEQMDAVKNYIELLSKALHYLRGESSRNPSTLEHVRVVLSSCEAMARRCPELDRCGSNRRKLSEKLAQGGALVACGVKPCNANSAPATQIDEALNGSKATALLVCGMLSIGLSFKSKRSLPAIQSRQAMSWSSSLHELQKEAKKEIDKRRQAGGPVLEDLRQAVVDSKSLKDLVLQRQPDNDEWKKEFVGVIESLRTRCGDLEDGIKSFEMRVNELYRHLISIRMTLLNIIAEG